MAKSVLDKIRKLKETRPKYGGGRMRGIFHEWKDGSNQIRLVGNFLEVKTHFIAPAPRRKDRGLCMQEAFDKDNDDRLPQVVNCPDWDLEKEEAKDKRTCPICRLNRLADGVLRAEGEKPNKEEKEQLENLRSSCRARTNLKWNVLDRDNSMVKKIDNDKEEDVLGLKIATIGMEAWDDIEGIFEQCGFDITDPEKGVDIDVVRGKNQTRVTYSAKAILEGTSLRITPFTEEETALEENNLKQICGKQTDMDKVVDALHGDLRELLELNDDDGDDDEKEKEKEKEKEEKEDSGSSGDDSDSSSDSSSEESEGKEESPSSNEGSPLGDDDDDDDGLMSDSKKK